MAEQGLGPNPGESPLEWPSAVPTSPVFRLLSITRSKAAELLEFDYDLGEILPYLEHGRIPPEITPAKTAIIFAASPGQRPRGYVLSKAAAVLLGLCDGRMSIRCIADRSLESRSGEPKNGRASSPRASGP